MTGHPFDDVLRSAGLLPDPPPEPAAPAPTTTNGDVGRYAAAALEAECAAVAAAAQGTRNDRLNKAAFSLGTLVGAGHLDRDTAADALAAAGRACGLSDTEIGRTIASGLDSGTDKPREVPLLTDEAGNTAFRIGRRVKLDQPSTTTNGATSNGTASNGTPGRRLRVTRADTVQPRRVRWLWDHRVVLGGLTLLGGREGLGKSTIAVDLAAQVSRGDLVGEHHGAPRTVIYVHSEDARDYTIVPRLIAAGADLTRVIFLDAVTEDEGQEFESPLVLPLDTELLAEVIAEHMPRSSCSRGHERHRWPARRQPRSADAAGSRTHRQGGRADRDRCAGHRPLREAGLR
jgi:hypothetical protein